MHNRNLTPSTTSRVHSAVFIGLVVIAAFFLIIEHWAHIWANTSYLLFALFILLHFVMHGSHGGHGGHDNKNDDKEGHNHGTKNNDKNTSL